MFYQLEDEYHTISTNKNIEKVIEKIFEVHEEMNQ